MFNEETTRAKSAHLRPERWHRRLTEAELVKRHRLRVEIPGVHAGEDVNRRASMPLQSLRISGRRAAAADPGPRPIRHLALVRFDIGTPGLGRQGLRLIYDGKLTIRLDFADH